MLDLFWVMNLYTDFVEPRYLEMTFVKMTVVSGLDDLHHETTGLLTGL